jgi:NADPH:quinone reductase-like Zn-dependent oxidoreductase
MKAAVCTKYGPPEVLQLKDVPKPVPKSDEVLIKVYASTVAAGDIRMRSFTWAKWFLLPGRFWFGFKKPRKPTPGNELAGEIEAVGSGVRKYKPGDQVFGIVWEVTNGGCNAEYKCMPEDRILLQPQNMTYEEAAGVPIGGLTALVLLKKCQIEPKQKVLIVGSSGSVGSFAVQMSNYFGAEVTGVCSTSNVELAKSLGAHHVIDYTKEDYRLNGETYDIIFDAVMKTSYSQAKKSLSEYGKFATVDWPFMTALWTTLFSKKKLKLGIANNIEDLNFLRELIESNKLRTVIDKTFPLEQIVEAHRYVEKGHKIGNVIITTQ